MALKDIDAVMIASPDHHTTHLEAAAKAEKDAYCEKPLAMDIETLKDACDAVKKANIVVQIGHPGPQLAELHRLPRAVQDRDPRQGLADRAVPQRRQALLVLGYVKDGQARRTWTGRNSSSIDRPSPSTDEAADRLVRLPRLHRRSDRRLRLPLHRPVQLHHRRQAPRELRRPGRHLHLEGRAPFTCPDHVQAMWIYPEGFMVSYSTNFGNGSGNSFKILGDEGVLDMVYLDRSRPDGEGGAKRSGKIRGKISVKDVRASRTTSSTGSSACGCARRRTRRLTRAISTRSPA